LHIIETIDSSQTLHSDKDHEVPFVSGPNTRITNLTWRMAAIWEKSKKIRHYLSNGLTDRHEFSTVMHIDPLDPSAP